MTGRVAAVALALTAACGGGGQPAPSGPPKVELGTGDKVFTPLDDGGSIDVALGPQGAYYVYGSIHASGIVPGDPNVLDAPDNPTTAFQVSLGATELAPAASYTQGLDPAPGGGYQMIGRFVILDIQSPTVVDGKDLRFEVQVTDVDGRTASDLRTLRAHSIVGP